MTVDLTAAEFHDEAAAREWLEGSRWPNGAYCPHCGSVKSFEWRVRPIGLGCSTAAIVVASSQS